MAQSDNKRMKILLGALLVVAAFAYFYIGGGSGAGDEFVGSEFGSFEVGDDREAVNSLLASVEKASLDQAILDDPEFMSLIDFTIPLPNLPIGRNNPFGNI